MLQGLGSRRGLRYTHPVPTPEREEREEEEEREEGEEGEEREEWE